MGYAPVYHDVTWTAAELIDEVTREARLPSSSDFTDAYILAAADDAIRSILTEPVLSNVGVAGRWLDYDDVLCSTGFRDGAEYLVPNASASGTVAFVDYYSASDANPLRLRQITAEETNDLLTDGGNGTGAPSYWHFRDNRIVVYPVPSSVGSTARVRVSFPRMHPRMVATADNVGVVSSASVGANSISIVGAAAPSNWPSTPYAVDLYSAQSPHAPLFSRLAVTSEASGIMAYTEPLDGESDLSQAAGFKVALSGTSDCVQLPPSMRKALTARVASFLLRQVGDEVRANSLWGVAREEIASAASQMQPRAKASRPVLVNRHSVLRTRSGRRWW